MPYTLPDSPPGTLAPDHQRVVQVRDRDGIIDLAWGHPDLGLLPVRALRDATVDVYDRYGPDALSYGRDVGPPPFVELVRDRLAATDGRVPAVDEIVVTAGATQALAAAALLLLQPGDVALVEEPTYHLAVKILRDHPVDLVTVPFDGGGIRTDAAAETIDRLRGTGRRVRMLYTIPTYHNPTGVTLSDARRQELVQLASDAGMTIVEDDVYRELGYEGGTPPSLWSIGAPGTVIRLGSFSKTLAPGLRLGYLTADVPTAGRARDIGVFDSGGGIAHLSALTVASYAAHEDYPGHIAELRALYRARRDAMLAALAEHLPEASWTQPRGGFFIWLTLPDGLDATALLPAAEARGVAYVPGRHFYAQGDGGRSALRIAFTRYPEAELAEAARRLGTTVRDARRRDPGPGARSARLR